MTRQTIDKGGWLDLDTAKKFKEDKYWDGNNYCSVNTRDQGLQQTLYRTKSGTYVLHQTSQWQGPRDIWTRLSADKAVEWLLRNDYEPDSPAELAITAALEA